MATGRSAKPRVAGIISLALIIGAGCSKRPQPLTADADLFAENVVVSRTEGGDPIAGDVEIALGAGFAIDVSVIPAAQLPDEIEGWAVNPPEQWSLMLVVSPKGSPEEGVPFPSSRVWRRNERPQHIPMTGGAAGVWSDFGFRGAPKASRQLRDREIRYWTYMAGPRAEPGDYEYEVTLLPTLREISAVRFEFGHQVVLQRGALRVSPAK